MPNGTASGTRVLRAASTPPLRVKQGSRDGSGAYGTIRAAGTVLLPTLLPTLLLYLPEARMTPSARQWMRHKAARRLRLKRASMRSSWSWASPSRSRASVQAL